MPNFSQPRPGPPADPAALPGPEGHPLLGMAPAFRRDMLGTLLEGFRRYGDLAAYRMGPRRGPGWMRQTIVVAHHPDGARQILTNGRVFVRATVGTEIVTEMVGSGLLTSDGEAWLRQRRTLQPLFTPRRVAGYADLMAAEAARVVDTWEAASGTEPDAAVDLHELMQRYTLRVLGRALFGDDIDDVVPDLQRLMPTMSDVVLARSLQLARPPLGLPTPRNIRFTRVRAGLYGVVDRILARRGPAGTAAEPSEESAAEPSEESAAEPGEQGAEEAAGGCDDLLGRLGAARDPENGRPLSTEEIRDQVLIFLLAGHETTAAALTFTLHLLGRHPDVQDAVAAAAASPTGADGDADRDRDDRDRGERDQRGERDDRGEPDHRGGRGDGDDLVRAAVQEGMRLYPPIYGPMRLAATETELAGHTLPAGTAVMASPWVTHRHPDFWAEPDRFDPTRFLGAHDRPRYAYFPFGGGPRSCIGEHFALLEATVLLRALLRRHRIDPIDTELKVTPLLTLRPAAPVHATLSPR
jgi:cytochrome P450